MNVSGITSLKLADEISDSDITLQYNEDTLELNKDITVSISGPIKGEGDDPKYFHVTLDGMVVARDANAETISQLPAGVYVLNSKVIIKK